MWPSDVLETDTEVNVLQNHYHTFQYHMLSLTLELM